MLRIRDVYPVSRILIFTHPGSRIPDLGSRIPDPKTATKERGKIFLLLTYLLLYPQISQNCKLFYFFLLKKKFGQIFKKLENFLPKKLSLSTGVWDPGSRGQKGTGSRIRIRNTAINITVYRNSIILVAIKLTKAFGKKIIFCCF